MPGVTRNVQLETSDEGAAGEYRGEAERESNTKNREGRKCTRFEEYERCKQGSAG